MEDIAHFEKGVLYSSCRKKIQLWGISSAGRALGWQPRGQRFDPAMLHFFKSFIKRVFSFVSAFAT
jgi:hypothetical protein